MPVKFRCQHCKQLLGISRRKVGQVVDCPKCGRSVRVPAEDGVARAAPEPELNLDDPALVKALDELAAIGQHGQSALALPAVPRRETNQPDAGDDDGWLDPEPLAAEPAPAAEKVHPPEPVPAVRELPATSSPKPIDPPKPVAPPAVAPAAQTLPAVGSSSADWRELAALGKPAKHADPQIVAMRPAAPGGASRLPVAIAGVGGLLIGLLLGFAGGYLLRPAPGPVRENARPAAPAEQKPDAKPAAEVVPALRGRITYRKAAAGIKGDEGARILVLPDERVGTVKLSPVGLRPGDADADQKLAISAVKILGGDLALAGSDGQFSIVLPGPGSYHIIAMSANQVRDSDQNLPMKLKTVVESYFGMAPDELIGTRAVHHDQISYKGAGTDPWDHSFDVP